MDITTNRNKKKNISERDLELPSKGRHTENIGKNRRKPEFDFNNQHVKTWIKEKFAEKQKSSPRLTKEEFIQSIYKKVKPYGKGRDDFLIEDEEFLYVFDGKICAWARDLWDMEELDWDDPKNKEWIEAEEKRMRHYWETTLQRMTREELGTMVDIKFSIRKANPKLTSKEASEIARKRVLAMRVNYTEIAAEEVSSRSTKP